MRWFKLSLMDLYLVRELTPPFIFSMGMFSSVGLAIGSLSDLINKITEFNLPWLLALEVLMLKLPEFVSYAFPISVLLTTLLTYSRLTKDSELIALRSIGVSVYRLVAPALIMSLLVTGVSFVFNELIVPSANFKATTILVQNLNEQRQYLLRSDIFYPEYQEVKQANGSYFKELKTLFYAKNFDGENMKQLTVLKRSESGLNNIIVSEKATWNNQQQSWTFFNGFIYSLNDQSSYQKSYHFKEKSFNLPKTPLELATKSRDPYEMNISQAKEYLKLLRLLEDEKKIIMFEVRTAQKLAFPFVCIIFGLVGSALGCNPNSYNKVTSFSLSVAIIFCYYLSGFFLSSLGLIGLLTPLMAAWLPNFLGLIIGGFLLYKMR